VAGAPGVKAAQAPVLGGGKIRKQEGLPGTPEKGPETRVALASRVFDFRREGWLGIPRIPVREVPNGALGNAFSWSMFLGASEGIAESDQRGQAGIFYTPR